MEHETMIGLGVFILAVAGVILFAKSRSSKKKTSGGGGSRPTIPGSRPGSPPGEHHEK